MPPTTATAFGAGRWMCALWLAASLGACRPAEPAGDPVRALFANGAAWVDLTYSYGAGTIYWPTAKPFVLEKVADGETPGGYYYAANNFSAAEHGGTHLDAPVHFARGKTTTDRVPLSRLIGPAAVVDVTAKTSNDPDYRVSVADLEGFEQRHGRLDSMIVLLRTGWGSRWPDRKAYLGTDATGPAAVPQLHFPGLDSAAAHWLAGRAIKALGIDTPSIDYGQTKTYPTHQILFAADIPAFENVANLDRLPETGAFVIALPMKIEGGSGGPLRIVASWGAIGRVGAR